MTADSPGQAGRRADNAQSRQQDADLAAAEQRHNRAFPAERGV